MQEALAPIGRRVHHVLDGGFSMVDGAGGTLARAGAGDSVTFRSGIPTSWTQRGISAQDLPELQPPDTDPR